MENESQDNLIINQTIIIELAKNLKDLLLDLNRSFNDKVGDIIENDEGYNYIINYNGNIDVDTEDEKLFNYTIKIFNYCIDIFPKKFFDILYQNEEMFNEPIYLLPGINFSEIYLDNLTENTKNVIWKYLQLLLFTVITSIQDKQSFGNNEKLFEAINPDEFKNKLKDTMDDLEKIFSNKNTNPSQNIDISEMFNNLLNNADLSNIDVSNVDISNIFNNFANNINNSNLDISNIDISNIFNNVFDNLKNIDNSNIDISNIFNNIFNNLDSSNIDLSNTNSNKNIPNFNNIHDHINKLINGKIGSLAKELAEETAKDMDIDMDNLNSVNDVFKNMFKNPAKLMSLVNNIGSKIDNKMKDGSLKESELLEEASDLLKNMGGLSGMDNFADLFKSMNLDKMMPKGGKINKNAFQNMMDQNIKMSKMKDRMRDKVNKNKQPEYTKNYSEKSESIHDINASLKNLSQQIDNNHDFLNDILKKQNISSNLENRPATKNKKNNKKKPKK
jgi:hypothetical protein